MIKHITLVLLFLIALVTLWQCNFFRNNDRGEDNFYLNHSDTVKYVGMTKCLECHSDKASFLETGMGKSFGDADTVKSIIYFIKDNRYFDSLGNFEYYAYIQNNKLYLRERKKFENTFIQTLTKKVDYIIGSGHHTNSHILSRNGYLYQMPFTFYRQKGIMDFPPGFENGYNSRFSRKIGLECMTCHNAFPDFVKGSENKYHSVPKGIDCERCHGPGQVHVNQFLLGKRVDTSVAIDYSIVNPAKLSIERQFDICQRCHLQGNAVLKEGKSFYDFKPGQRLDEVMAVFLPRFLNADDEFIMASHADRLKQSKCFTESLKKIKDRNVLKPYKNALTCVTCHNPHIPVSKMGEDFFNKKCLNCHQAVIHKPEIFLSKNNPSKIVRTNCTGCHMPNSGSIDIPHVSIHDHFIRKPMLEEEVSKVKVFMGLQSINDKNPDLRTKIIAHLQQYEKFESKPYYLDTLENMFKSQTIAEKFFREFVWFLFLKNDFSGVVEFAEKSELISRLKNISFDNYDAWTLYRIGESYAKLNNSKAAINYLSRAVNLAPYNLEFKQKLAISYFNNSDTAKAVQLFELILQEDDEYVPALNGLGFVFLAENNLNKANYYLTKALYLDPNNELVLLNNINMQMLLKNKSELIKLISRLQKINPAHPKLKAIKQMI